MKATKISFDNGLLFVLATATMFFILPKVSYAVESPYATGGNVTTFLSVDGFYDVYVHTFTNNSEVKTFRNLGKRTLSLRYLVVGGGGAGSAGTGSGAGGAGGGGGGVVEASGLSLERGGVLSVEVGAGAPTVTSSNRDSVAGTSRIRDGETIVAEAPGGGNAGLYISNSECVAATGGANGGGAARGPSGASIANPGGAGTFTSLINGTAYGPFNGGSYSNARTGGSGAGAGANGGSPTGNQGNGAAAVGGEGLVSDITGESLVYGSGGGAGETSSKADAYPGRQGSSGGTRAGNGTMHDFTIVDEGGIVTTNFNYIAATAPAANSGAGGGGGGIAAYGGDSYRQGTGGADGVVVIRYQIPISPCVGGDVVIKRLIKDTRYSYVHIFTNTAEACSFENQTDDTITLRYLVVGGGGAGSAGTGSGAGGAGGGGGGVVEVRGFRLQSGENLSVEVGAGAPTVTSSNRDSVAGTSRIRDGETIVAEAPGGGNAGLYISNSECVAATGGANGGGAARGPSGASIANPGGAGTFTSLINGTAYGPFNGGSYSNARTGGSGAGACANGGSPTGNQGNGAAAVGGEGLVSDITGESLVYGSGGGAGETSSKADAYPGRQGSSGGTRAGNGTMHDFTIVDEGGIVTTNFNYIAATAPAANSGAGGGGGGIAAYGGDSYRQGTGGADGIVVIQYQYDFERNGLIFILK